MPADWMEQQIEYLDAGTRDALVIRSAEDLRRRIKSLAVQVGWRGNSSCRPPR